MSYILDAIQKAEPESNICHVFDYDSKNTKTTPIFFSLSLIVLLILLSIIF